MENEKLESMVLSIFKPAIAARKDDSENHVRSLAKLEITEKLFDWLHYHKNNDLGKRVFKTREAIGKTGITLEENQIRSGDSLHAPNTDRGNIFSSADEDLLKTLGDLSENQIKVLTETFGGRGFILLSGEEVEMLFDKLSIEQIMAIRGDEFMKNYMGRISDFRPIIELLTKYSADEIPHLSFLYMQSGDKEEDLKFLAELNPLDVKKFVKFQNCPTLEAKVLSKIFSTMSIDQIAAFGIEKTYKLFVESRV